MKTFKNLAAQGDVMFKRINKLPSDLREIEAKDDKYIVAHSETGHHHVIQEQKGVKLYQPVNDNFIAYLVVDNTAKDVRVEHMRGFDTHETIAFSPGIYEVRRQREYTPEGYRRAQD